jgi:hypothetical protein
MFVGIIGMRLCIASLSYLVLIILCTFLLLRQELVTEGVGNG